MDLARQIYERSPVFLQNALISLYGYRLRRLRYGRVYRQHLAFLGHSQYWSQAELRAYQEQRLAELLQHAYRYVPFYREQLDERGIKPGAVSIDSLAQQLPVLTKQALRAAPECFRSSFFCARDLTTIHTSGTTGSPLDILTTRSAVQQNYAFFARFLGWAGVRVGEPSATFAGRIFIPREQTKPPYWRSNRALSNVLFSSYHLSDESIPHYLKELQRLQPRFIDSYPSAVDAIARYVNEHRLELGFRPTAIVTSSETLRADQRAAITQAFGGPVFDQYGSAEMVAFVGQCEHGSYHLNPEYGLLELVDERGQPVAPGETGEMLFTGFLNHAMPLIRYRIGDSAVLSDKACNCGRHFPVIESLLGRTDDLILTPDGRHVGRLDPIFKGLAFIKEAQIVQESLAKINVRLVREPGYTEDVGAALIEALKQRLGKVEVGIEYLEEIPRTSAGKFRSVVSKIARS